MELRARVLLDSGEGAGLVAELGAHVAEHPWREPAWALLARALHRAGRRADAQATLRRARATLTGQLGLDPGADLQRLETDILNGSTSLDGTRTGWTGPGVRLGPRTTVDLARTLALAGGDALVHARRDRLAAVRAVERTGDLALTARIIGAYDVPALWSRADDPEQSRAVVEAAERTLTALGPEGRVDQARTALAAVPAPPPDHMQEALWCLTARAAVRLGERDTAARAVAALRGARAEHAGAASGMLTLGPVARYLAEAEACAAAG